MNNSIFPWKTLAIASAALIVLFVGGFLISGNQPVESKQTYKAPANTASNGVAAANTNKIEPQNYQQASKPLPGKKAVKKKPTETVDTSKSAVTEEEATPIDEMVVMGMAAQADKATVASIREAHPKIGWGNFENYIKEKAVSPDGKAGTVKVAFIVNTDGTCDNFKVKSGLTEAADQKAIELIKNGPSWTGNADGQARETTVNVEFH